MQSAIAWSLDVTLIMSVSMIFNIGVPWLGSMFLLLHEWCQFSIAIRPCVSLRLVKMFISHGSLKPFWTSMSMIQSLFAQLAWLMQSIKSLIWLLKMWQVSIFTPWIMKMSLTTSIKQQSLYLLINRISKGINQHF